MNDDLKIEENTGVWFRNWHKTSQKIHFRLKPRLRDREWFKALLYALVGAPLIYAFIWLGSFI